MNESRFQAGQKVTVALSKRYRAPNGEYRIVGAMPPSGGPQQYRIKGDLESYERVIDELHLEAIELP